jgi:hypothetical protein
MNYNSISDNLNAIRQSDGAVINAAVQGDPALFGVTLTAVRHMFPFGAERSPVPSATQITGVHLRWDNVIAFTATVEETIFPARWPSDQANGVTDVADNALLPLGSWIVIKPPDAYVEVVGGGTYTIATGTIAVAAGQAGGCTINLSAWAGRRGRININVTTPGLVRCGVNGKCAA